LPSRWAWDPGEGTRGAKILPQVPPNYLSQKGGQTGKNVLISLAFNPFGQPGEKMSGGIIKGNSLVGGKIQRVRPANWVSPRGIFYIGGKTRVWGFKRGKKKKPSQGRSITSFFGP